MDVGLKASGRTSEAFCEVGKHTRNIYIYIERERVEVGLFERVVEGCWITVNVGLLEG